MAVHKQQDGRLQLYWWVWWAYAYQGLQKEELAYATDKWPCFISNILLF